jgi:hypothetical protein
LKVILYRGNEQSYLKNVLRYISMYIQIFVTINTIYTQSSKYDTIVPIWIILSAKKCSYNEMFTVIVFFFFFFFYQSIRRTPFRCQRGDGKHADVSICKLRFPPKEYVYSNHENTVHIHIVHLNIIIVYMFYSLHVLLVLLFWNTI